MKAVVITRPKKSSASADILLVSASMDSKFASASFNTPTQTIFLQGPQVTYATTLQAVMRLI